MFTTSPNEKNIMIFSNKKSKGYASLFTLNKALNIMVAITDNNYRRASAITTNRKTLLLF